MYSSRDANAVALYLVTWHQNMAASSHPSIPSLLPLCIPPATRVKRLKKATSHGWFQRANFCTHSTKIGLDTRSKCIGTDGMETQTGMGRCLP